MTFRLKPLIVFERAGVGELALGLWCAWHSGHVRYFRATKIAARWAACKQGVCTPRHYAGGETPA
jgi:hypothetical protein